MSSPLGPFLLVCVKFTLYSTSVSSKSFITTLVPVLELLLECDLYLHRHAGYVSMCNHLSNEFLSVNICIPETWLSWIIITCSDYLFRMNHFDYQDYLHYLLPDVVVIVTCLVVLILGLKAIRQQNNQQSGDAGEGQQNNRQSQHSHGFIQKVIAVHSVIFFLSLFLAAVIRPSILTGIYLLLLLAIGMVWSTYHSFPVILHWSKLLTIIYAGLHLFVLYAYQFYAFQDEFSADNKWIK